MVGTGHAAHATRRTVNPSTARLTPRMVLRRTPSSADSARPATPSAGSVDVNDAADTWPDSVVLTSPLTYLAVGGPGEGPGRSLSHASLGGGIAAVAVGPITLPATGA